MHTDRHDSPFIPLTPRQHRCAQLRNDHIRHLLRTAGATPQAPIEKWERRQWRMILFSLAATSRQHRVARRREFRDLVKLFWTPTTLPLHEQLRHASAWEQEYIRQRMGLPFGQVPPLSCTSCCYPPGSRSRAQPRRAAVLRLLVEIGGDL